jgi:hypothetical protein
MRKTPGVEPPDRSVTDSPRPWVSPSTRVRGSGSRTFVILGDGELQEGLVWEGAMAAAKYGLTAAAIAARVREVSAGAVPPGPQRSEYDV